ncbi:hypothetical protein [Parasedimentitalea psychrophila]|uniref:Secreted protein n=1 Tax=Parasedimentitalea psychrophila TaxID=2997337 RepID=A0A9Y2P9A1_9RHOB|nr:hypothetical protein [Parasedimentitalea psychrophila]WIY27765.1 hypothetical protein QPJ95_23910 [Parasedimentitalea psychrophila]
MNLLRVVLLSLSVVVFFLPQSAQAQTEEPENPVYPEYSSSEESEGRSGDFDLERENGPKLNNPDEIVPQLAAIHGRCGVADVYVIDCLAERLEVLEKSMSGLARYGEARRILRDTADQLRQITQDNLDQDRPRARMEAIDGSFRSTRPLSAVSAAQRRSAISQAVAVLAEAETQLLRSGEASLGRAVQYQQIAAALGSNKVLLRSS